jgi:glutathione peroxidase
MYRYSALTLLTFSLLGGICSPAWAGEKGGKKVAPVLNFKMTSLDGKTVDLAKLQGKVVLFVNVASECGFTPQYKGLQALHKKYANDGLVIVGVPSNDFGKQEPGTNEEIAAFCKKEYGVEFPMLAKVVVKGKDQCPLYKFLTSKETNPKFAGAVQWNFEKFLIGRNGQVMGRFESKIDPVSEDFQRTLRDELARKAP